MDGVGLLGQNHAGYSHSGIPEVIQPTQFPQAEQSQDEHDREEFQPHFVNCVASVKDESRRDRHGQRCYSAYVDRKSTRLNSSHRTISYAVFCLKKKKKKKKQ